MSHIMIQRVRDVEDTFGADDADWAIYRKIVGLSYGRLGVLSPDVNVDRISRPSPLTKKRTF